MSTAATATWDGLLSAAIVGSERNGEPTQLVLRRAALLGGIRRVGWTPPPPPAEVAGAGSAPPEVAPEASDTAVQLLELLLAGAVTVAGGPDPLIADWLDRAGRNHVRVPHRLVTAILERATANRDLRVAAVDAIGERGRWLAARNPAWAWSATEGEGDGDWEAGTREQRLAHLRQLRAVDPVAAIVLVETTWSTESAEVRQRILATLAGGGLVPTDEAFLVAATADRAVSVRRVAEAMLDALPASARAQERQAELAGRVRLEGRVRKKLVVDEPALVLQRVDVVPLRWWSDHLGLAPSEVVALAAEQGPLIDALIRATVRQRDGDWADALLRHGRPNPAQAVTLVGVAPASSPWLVGELRRLGQKAAPVLHQSAAALGATLDPAVVPDLEAWMADLGDDDATRRRIRHIIQALTIRATIAEELP